MSYPSEVIEPGASTSNWAVGALAMQSGLGAGIEGETSLGMDLVFCQFQAESAEWTKQGTPSCSIH